MKSFMNSTYYDRTGKRMSEVTVTSFYALIVAIFAVGGMFGGLAAGWWADFFGRYTFLGYTIDACCIK